MLLVHDLIIIATIIATGKAFVTYLIRDLFHVKYTARLLDLKRLLDTFEHFSIVWGRLLEFLIRQIFIKFNNCSSIRAGILVVAECLVILFTIIMVETVLNLYVAPC